MASAPGATAGTRVRPAPALARLREWRYAGDALGAAAAMGLSLVVAVLVLRAWHGIAGLPWFYGATVPSRFGFDVDFHLLAVKGVLEHGWYFTNPDLGAPFTQKLLDFPQGGDNLQYLLIKVLGIGSSDLGTIVNLYYLLTFPLTALGAFAGFRWLGVSRPAAVVVAVLFTALPYHFLRGEYHLFLSLYATAALGAFLVLSVIGGRRLFERRPAGARRLLRWASPRSLGVVALCVLIGSTEPYYANLTMLLLAIAALLRFAVVRRREPLVTGAVAIALIAATLTVNLAPSIAYGWRHGRDTAVAHREAGESELYSLRLTQLVLPSRLHRLEPLADLGERYTRTELPSDEQTATLGIVATLGFGWLLVLALLTVAGGLRGGRALERHRHASVAAVVALLVGTTGGGSALIAYLGTAQLRAWNRLSIFIAFFALLAVALGLDALRRRIRGRPRGALLGGLALGAVLLIGVLDQTSPRFAPDYAVAGARWDGDARFVHRIESTLPAGSMVYQLPYIAFPESPPRFGMIDYDQARGYIHSSTLRWSYGGVKGRSQTDWQDRLNGRRPGEILPAIAAIGYGGLWVDRFGYGEADLRRLESAIHSAAGPPAFTSDEGRLEFYDLRPYAARLAEERGPAELEQLSSDALGGQTPPPG